MTNIAVIGAGTMGSGIAHVFAQYNYKVSLIDINPESLKNAIERISINLDRQISKGTIPETLKTSTLANLQTSTQLSESLKDADLVIEAATENPDTKFKLFAQIDKLCPPHTILASNTSSISITQIAAHTQRPEKVIGMHFMNPVPVMKLVEIIRGYKTDNATSEIISEICLKIEKKPVEVNDYPGFIANRILMPMLNEAIRSLHEGVGGVAEIDAIMKLGMAHPMGPLQLADFIGLDICLSIMQVLHAGLGSNRYAPSPLLVNMVAAGNLGAKTGEGFYTWKKGSKELTVAPNFTQKH